MTKQQWALSKAKEAREAAMAVRADRSGDWRARQRRDAAVRHLEREAERFERIAERYRTAA